MEIKKIRSQGLERIVGIPKKSNLTVGDFVVLLSIDELFEKALLGDLSFADLHQMEKEKIKEDASRNDRDE